MESSSREGGGRFPILQAHRDPVSNFELDIAKSLEEYLLKICSGEITGEDGAQSVNFAEAALLIQGSVQIYSRKVEYLYSLVLNALVLSQKKQDQQENGSAQDNENDLSTNPNEDDDIFSGLDDVPAEARITLNNNVDRDVLQRKVVRPPADLLVFEGDCLDSEASELDSYMLTTCNFFGHFLLLDPCDAPAVFDFLQGKKGKENSVAHRGSPTCSKSPTGPFISPNRKPGSTGSRLNPEKGQGDPDQTQETNTDQSQGVNENETQENIDQSQGVNENETQENINDFGLGDNDWSYDNMHPSDSAAEFPDDGDDSDDEDPWRPMDPHGPGNLKIRQYKRVKGFARQVTGTTKKKTLASLFPMANMDVTNPEQEKSFGVQQSQPEEVNASQSPLYEKLMRSFEFGEQENCNVFGDLKDDGGPDNGVNDYDDDDEPGIPYDMDPMDSDDIIHPAKDNDPLLGETQVTQNGLDEHENLDDLCRSDLNALLASIAEVEQRSEMDARVSTWKERIEAALEQQDEHPPFDIGSYGEQILDTLSSGTDDTGIASFGEIVCGKPKYEVARTFSALLQLVNARSVDLDKRKVADDLVYYTADNPFHVKLIGPSRRPEVEARFAQKRVNSPLQRCGKGSDSPPPLSQQKPAKKQAQENGKNPVNTAIRLTPDGKRRRRSSRPAQLLNLSPADENIIID